MMKKYWIITAMDEEAQHIISLYGLKFTRELYMVKFFENDSIVLALTWVWKIQASIWATVLCIDYDVENIINIWIAGNLKWCNVKIWDVYLVNKIFQHDIYLPFSWDHLDYCKWVILVPKCDIVCDFSSDFDLYFGWVCVTWDVFVDDKDKSEQLSYKYNADVVEMEAFSVASVAREFWKLGNLFVVKAVSDWADSDAIDAHESNLDFAMANSLKVLRCIIK